MDYSLIDFFTDPVLRAPTIGSILMCLASSLVGVIVFIRKRSLLGEALSHASYPGVALGVILLAVLVSPMGDAFAAGILICAFLSSLAGLVLIDFLQRYFKVKDDASLCFVLSSFFGLGILIASRVQITHALWYKQIQAFLYGQAATMRDVHIVVYGSLFVLILTGIVVLFREIEALIFDRNFSKSIGIRVKAVDAVLFLLLVLAIVIGIRSVGVVLMSGMLIAPAIAARQFTHKLGLLFIFSSIIGAVSGFAGNYLSVMIPSLMAKQGERFSLPTGPMILLVAAGFCLFSLILAPERGLVSRMLRMIRFRRKCELENILKAFWKGGDGSAFSLREIQKRQNLSFLKVFFRLRKLVAKGWVQKLPTDKYSLTSKGKEKAARIIRLHRLWELYLVHLGHCKEKVHASAEEMEHVLTPELEKQLTELLNNPVQDPHNQPIPHGGKA